MSPLVTFRRKAWAYCPKRGRLFLAGWRYALVEENRRADLRLVVGELMMPPAWMQQHQRHAGQRHRLPKPYQSLLMRRFGLPLRR
jgi:hypothetical protein